MYPAGTLGVPFAYIAYANSPTCSFVITLGQPDLVTVGFTQASIVNPVVKSSEFESGTVTILVNPLNKSEDPYFPVDQVAPLTVPLFKYVEWSPSTAPAFSLKLYAATRSGDGVGVAEGVGVGVGLTVGMGDGDEDGVGAGVGLVVGLGDPVGVGPEVEVGVGVIKGVGDGLTVGTEVGVPVGVGEPEVTIFI